MATLNKPPEKSDAKPDKKSSSQDVTAPVGERLRNYLKGVRSEWGKISWPTWPQIWGQTIVVLVMVSVMTLGLFIMDNSFHLIIKLITPHRSYHMTTQEPDMDIAEDTKTPEQDLELDHDLDSDMDTDTHIDYSITAERNANKAITVTAEEDRPLKKPPRRRWYIVHTYSGHENKVKVNLERRIESMNMQDKIFRVEVPQKSVTKIKDGKRTEKEERIFPGYVLVEMLMDDDSWYVVRHTPGVTKFVGSQKKPIPAKDAEIKRILLRSQPTAGVTKIEIDLKMGEVVKIISGPFADFEGTVTEVNPEKERLKASVSIFGRETPVELAFNQVQKSR